MTNADWLDLMSSDDLIASEVVSASADGWEFAVYQVDGAVYATDGFCSHGNARLCDGFLDGHEIECPLHQGKFDIRTGQALCAPATQAVRTYPLKIESGRVWVQVF